MKVKCSESCKTGSCSCEQAGPGTGSKGGDSYSVVAPINVISPDSIGSTISVVLSDSSVGKAQEKVLTSPYGICLVVTLKSGESHHKI